MGRLLISQTIKPTDHNSVHYVPVRKALYVETPEVGAMDEHEVAAIRAEFGVKTRGKDVPKPIRTWLQCGLSNKLLESIKKLHWDKPTPIQAQSIPVIMSGRDFIGVAKTGSGKTGAYLLPLLRHVLDQPPIKVGEGPSDKFNVWSADFKPVGIIFAPSRELAIQICHDANKFVKGVNLRAVRLDIDLPLTGLRLLSMAAQQSQIRLRS